MVVDVEKVESRPAPMEVVALPRMAKRLGYPDFETRTPETRAASIWDTRSGRVRTPLVVGDTAWMTWNQIGK